MNELILDIFLILVGVSCIVAPIWFGISLHKFRKTRKEGNLKEQSGHRRSLIASSIVLGQVAIIALFIIGFMALATAFVASM